MEICNSIEFNINNKVKTIELWLGDITDLSLKDSVDVLLISAFEDNYTPIKGTLIGALYDKFQLSIKALAKDKAEDLRKHFNCWISRDLPSNLPYRRILCFEQNIKNCMREDQSNLVGSMFRALFTTFKNNTWSLITPILATGCQKSNKIKMLSEMVRGCSAWITAEMPLCCMKIVIFKGKCSNVMSKDDYEAIEQFARLKSEMNWMPFKNVISVKRDAIFFYVKKDEEFVNIFLELLTGFFHEDKVMIKLKCLDNEYSFHSNNYAIYEKYQKKMLESLKVVLFLSVDFLQHSQAIEVYNLALCLSQKTQKSLFTPVCFKRIDGLPEYMTIHQWIDCRIKSKELEIKSQIQKGAQSFFQTLQYTRLVNKSNESQSDLPNFKKEQQHFSNNYDIFISYAHKDDMKCRLILNFLQYSLPNKKIFYDKNDIKTGYSWQEKIFNSLNGSKIIIALLSENYIQSDMCRDEFNIAISQNNSLQFDTKLFPIWISDKSIQSVIMDCTKYFNESFLINNIFIPEYSQSSSDILSEDLKILSLFQYVIKHIIRPLLLGENIDSYFLEKTIIDLEEATLSARTIFFNETWKLNESINFIPFKKQTTSNENINIIKENDIAIGFHNSDLNCANYIKKTILKLNKELKIIFCSMGPESNEWLSLKNIETAYIIIILMKPFYISTKSCLDQLHIALSLQRRNVVSGIIVLPLILETLPEKPFYLHLLPSRFNAEDEIYVKIAKKIEYSKQNKSAILYDSTISKKMAIMLTFASYWIAKGPFLDKIFNAPKTIVIYSTYDLINSQFHIPKCADVNSAIKQIKMLKVTQQHIDLAEIFQSYNSCLKLEKLRTSIEKIQIVDKTDIKKLKKTQSHVITKVCCVV